MRLTLQSQKFGDVVVIRCEGRIVAGPEVEALEAEVGRQTRVPGSRMLATRKVLLNLAETSFIDSSGMGALVRLLGVFRSAECDLKLCDLSPFVLRVLQITHLTSVFSTYATEADALEAFSKRIGAADTTHGTFATRIVCIDTSKDLLAYLSALLHGPGYEVLTTRHPGEAITLVSATKPKLVIFGPGTMRTPMGAEAIDRLRKTSPGVGTLVLPPDFSTAEAGDAGFDLVTQVQSLLKA